MSKDTKQIALRVTEEMHARLKGIADRERRSLHAQVVYFLDDGIEQWEREHPQEEREQGAGQ
jgi:hypothetical protein